MPLTGTCPEHPDVRIANMTDVLDHARTAHPAERVQDVSDRIPFRCVSQAVAQGNEVRTIAHCWACAAPMTATVDGSNLCPKCQATR